MFIDIRVPYTTRPVMQRRTRPAFIQQPLASKIQSKHDELTKHGQLLWGVTDVAKNHKLIEIAATHCGRPVTDNIVDLAMSFQEDLVIMHQGKMAATCFCFPSGWIPKEKLGLTLEDIHRPVADSHDLVRKSSKLSQAMADPTLGGFERTVWTLTANAGLNNMPNTDNILEPKSLQDLYFRWELQTTEPLKDGKTSLFFVDTNVIPLLDIWVEMGSMIKDSVNSMSDNILTYKNLHLIKKIINMNK